MKVAMWYNNRDVRIEDKPTPKIGRSEVLVRVEASGICGSDVLEWYRIDRAPLILGHEVSGQIVAVGEGVKRYKEGDRVSAAHHVPCNTCHYCRSGRHTVCDTLRRTNFDPGGLAEYVRLPAINVDRGVFPLPDEVTFEEATFVEPLACILRGQRQAGLKPAQSVLVICSGISGQLHIRLARAQAAGRIIATDITEFRLQAAQRMGTGVVINGRGDVPEPGLTEDPDHHVAQGGHHLGGGAGADLAAVLIEGHIAHPVEPVLDRPVGAVEGEQPGGIRGGGREAGDPVGHLRTRVLPVEIGRVAFEAEDLGRIGEREVADELGAGPNPPGFDAPVPLVGVSVLRGEMRPAAGRGCLA